jgi:hypothetical protein
MYSKKSSSHRQGLALLLAVSFFIAPLQVALAEEVVETEAAPAIQTTPDSPPGDASLTSEGPTSEPLTVSDTGTDEGSGEEGSLGLLTEEDPFPFTYERVSHASVPKLTPDESTGALRYSFPIVTPSGRKGLEPQLELLYDSRNTKNEYLGLGWSTNIPYIERVNRTGAENLYTDNYFYSSLDGELREVTPSGGDMEMGMGGGELFDMMGESALTTESIESGESIMALLQSKTADERADIKSAAIANIGSVSRTERGSYDIEIVSIEAIQGGVQAFVRAWDAGGQIGFGADGTVEIERFRIFNPPILVPDENGEILQEWQEELSDGSVILHSRRLREDLREALLQVVEHNLSVMNNIHGDENIIPGKIGRTTSTFYSGSGDGYSCTINSYPTWSSARNATAGNGTDDTSIVLQISAEEEPGSTYAVCRAFLPFDTSALPDSAVLSSSHPDRLQIWCDEPTNLRSHPDVTDKHFKLGECRF